MGKKNTELKFLVGILLIVTILMGGYIAYDKVLKDNKKEKTKETKKVAKTNNEKTDSELYQEYLDNLKANINSNYKRYQMIMRKTEYDNQEYLSKEDGVIVAFIEDEPKYVNTSLNKSGLEIIYDGNTIKKVKNVIYSRIIKSETSTETRVYYITYEGKVYYIDMLLDYYDGFKIENPIELKGKKI